MVVLSRSDPNNNNNSIKKQWYDHMACADPNIGLTCLGCVSITNCMRAVCKCVERAKINAFDIKTYVQILVGHTLANFQFDVIKFVSRMITICTLHAQILTVHIFYMYMYNEFSVELCYRSQSL